MTRLAILLFCCLICCKVSNAQNDSVFTAMPVTLFEDNFQSDSVGTFPSHWRISHRDSARYKRLYRVRNVGGKRAMVTKVWTDEILGMKVPEFNVFGQPSPRMPQAEYLPDSFTMEYDFRIGKHIWMDLEFYATNAAPVLNISIGENKIGYVDYSKDDNDDDITGGSSLSSFKIDKWHHMALLYSGHEAICYIDGKKIMNIPPLQRDPLKFFFGIGGFTDPRDSMAYTNFRLAGGAALKADFTSLLKKNSFTTHDIVFDVNKCEIKMESTAYIKQFANWLKANPTVKLEIGGHTDNDGDAATNLILSQKRADAVRTVLVSLGINGQRLTTKGYGDTKPIKANNTAEGKADNRRVEFIRKS